jgi:acyl dehydratase
MSRDITFKYWNEISEGDVVTPVTMDVPFERVILDAAATQDYFPGHHNPAYARHQGQKEIYLNTMAIEGFIDRVVTDWAGPHVFIRKRQMQMRSSIYAGDTLQGEGTVEKCYNENDQHLVDVKINISTQSGLCVPAALTLELPADRPS